VIGLPAAASAAGDRHQAIGGIGMRIKPWLFIAILSAALLPAAQDLRAQNATPLPVFKPFWIGNEAPPKNLRRDPARPPAWIGLMFQVTPPQGAIVNWTATVTASGQALAHETVPIQGGGTIYYRIDPCAVTDLDMPGTQIPVDYEFVFAVSGPNYFFNPPVFQGHFDLTLTPDTVAPELVGYALRPTVAHRDETVTIAVDVTDDSEEMGRDPVWDSGLRVLSLDGRSNPDQASTQTYEVDDSWPQTCADRVKRASHTFSYTVPHDAQPGDVITLVAAAQDWTGNRGTQDITLNVVGSEPDEDQQAGGDSFFPPGASCSDARKTRYIYDGRDGKCDGLLHICDETYKVACPFTGFNVLATYADGPAVCCDDWVKARQSNRPCDVSQDADCDGIRNTQDNDPLRTGNPPPRRYNP